MNRRPDSTTRQRQPKSESKTSSSKMKPDLIWADSFQIPDRIGDASDFAEVLSKSPSVPLPPAKSQIPTYDSFPSCSWLGSMKIQLKRGKRHQLHPVCSAQTFCVELPVCLDLLPAGLTCWCSTSYSTQILGIRWGETKLILVTLCICRIASNFTHLLQRIRWLFNWSSQPFSHAVPCSWLYKCTQEKDMKNLSYAPPTCSLSGLQQFHFSTSILAFQSWKELRDWHFCCLFSFFFRPSAATNKIKGLPSFQTLRGDVAIDWLRMSEHESFSLADRKNQ